MQITSQRIADVGVRVLDSAPRLVTRGCMTDATPDEEACLFHFCGSACRFVSLVTNGNGACTLHSVYAQGLLNGELFCEDARLAAATAFRAFRLSGSSGFFFKQDVLPAIWGELGRPAAMHKVLGSVEPELSASRLFWRLLEERNPAACSRVEEHVTEA